MNWPKIARYITSKIYSALVDLLPIIVVILVFQFLILQKPLPNYQDLIIGSLLVWIGLILFMEGLEWALFPLGNSMAFALTNKGNVFLILLFAFTLGFSTTIAEPALIAVAKEAARVSSEAGYIGSENSSLNAFARGLRVSVAISVGFAILIGVLRIFNNWPLQYIIISGYAIVVILTFIAPKEIIGIAYDTGGVATSTITVPLVTALGVGLASSIKGRNPLTDGFGLIAIAVMMPMIFVMIYGLIVL
ncbi:DUF1538 domain-containing protein [Mongoliitalea daihaiensis]|uniref:DUF1538 domain-containing protein n=1 Tax=Mongoliitalea daihaiensis TaxID=2782006 RepID=UPI001F378A6B|nr:DUF1538 domain-containing protein [Mongoliitalea daihaiensis]